MRLSAGTIAAAAIAILVTASLWPDQGPLVRPEIAEAQQPDPVENVAPPRPVKKCWYWKKPAPREAAWRFPVESSGFPTIR